MTRKDQPEAIKSALPEAEQDKSARLEKEVHGLNQVVQQLRAQLLQTEATALKQYAQYDRVLAQVREALAEKIRQDARALDLSPQVVGTQNKG